MTATTTKTTTTTTTKTTTGRRQRRKNEKTATPKTQKYLQLFWTHSRNTLAISTALVIFLMLQHFNFFNGGAQAHTRCCCILVATPLQPVSSFSEEILPCTYRFKIYVAETDDDRKGAMPKFGRTTINAFI